MCPKVHVAAGVVLAAVVSEREQLGVVVRAHSLRGIRRRCKVILHDLRHRIDAAGGNRRPVRHCVVAEAACL